MVPLRKERPCVVTRVLVVSGPGISAGPGHHHKRYGITPGFGVGINPRPLYGYRRKSTFTHQLAQHDMAGLMALVPDLLARVANLLDVDDKAAFRASCKGPMEAVFDSTTALTWRGRKADQPQSPTDHYMNALSEEGMVMLGKCPRLHKLVISSMRVADLAPLSALTGLTSLECPRWHGAWAT